VVLGHSRPYGVAEVMETVIARARARAAESERREVAAEIRRAVEESGLTRAEFARRVGTSASRLSTYLSGRVVPSATLMVRIRRLRERLISGPHGPAVRTGRLPGVPPIS
jgi:DNA-binding transcriptional regulator YiaG